MSRSFDVHPSPTGRETREGTRRRSRLASVPAIGLLVLAGLVWLGGAGPAGAHTELARAEPPAGGVLAAPPGRLDLWFTEPVMPGFGSPTLRLIDDEGKETRLRRIEVDLGEPRHVRADVVDAGAGSQTVVWSVRAADGHTMSGSYAFRVGSGRAPGAATTEGEGPRAWGVATRWLTFLGAALAVGGYGFARVVLGRSVAGDAANEAPARARRRVAAVLAGAAVALVATLAEPVLTTVAPPAGALPPDLGEAFGGLAGGWWLRLTALALSVVLAGGLLGVVRGGRPLPLPRTHDWVGLGLGLAALVGLGLTSHAAAGEEWRGMARAANVVHQWAVALWVGGLAHLALAWPIRPPGPGLGDPTSGEPAVEGARMATGATPVRRFARLALGLAIVGVATGVLNAGLVLPSVGEVWESAYGKVVLLKALALVPALALATFHRDALRNPAGKARLVGAAVLTRRVVRVEAALVALVALGGSVLALAAVPGGRGMPVAAMVDLAAPAGGVVGGGGAIVRLQVQPAQTGSNALVVRLTDGAGAPLPAGAAPPLRVDAVGLDHPGERLGIVPGWDSSGAYAIVGVGLEGAGWWRLEVILSPPGQAEERVPFYLLLPDPNVHGTDEAPTPPTTAEAEAVFRRGLSDLTALHRVRWSERLAGGTGTFVLSDQAVSDGSDGRPPGFAVSGGGVSLVRVGEREWLRRAGEAWTEREAGPVFTPAAWGETYERATHLRLGRVEEVDGEACQVVTFVVPAEGATPAAWYAWWVGTESGHVRRMAMVSTSHYMIQGYRDFDAPLVIAPPADAELEAPPVGTPVGTPNAGI